MAQCSGLLCLPNTGVDIQFLLRTKSDIVRHTHTHTLDGVLSPHRRLQGSGCLEGGPAPKTLIQSMRYPLGAHIQTFCLALSFHLSTNCESSTFSKVRS